MFPHLQAVYDAHGPTADVLRVKMLPMPQLGKNDVLIQVQAAALNPVD